MPGNMQGVPTWDLSFWTTSRESRLMGTWHFQGRLAKARRMHLAGACTDLMQRTSNSILKLGWGNVRKKKEVKIQLYEGIR